MPLVLLVDDSAGFRATARLLLESEGYDVAEAGTGAEGLRRARDLVPGLVLLDIRLPDLDGFEVAERLTGLDPRPEVILISSRDASDYGSLVANAAVRGFIPKSQLSGASIRALVEG